MAVQPSCFHHTIIRTASEARRTHFRPWSGRIPMTCCSTSHAKSNPEILILRTPVPICLNLSTPQPISNSPLLPILFNSPSSRALETPPSRKERGNEAGKSEPRGSDKRQSDAFVIHHARPHLHIWRQLMECCHRVSNLVDDLAKRSGNVSFHASNCKVPTGENGERRTLHLSGIPLSAGQTSLEYILRYPRSYSHAPNHPERTDQVDGR